MANKPVKKSFFVRGIMANAAGHDIPAWSLTYIIENFPIQVQKALKVVDDQQIGELIFAEIAVNSTLMIPQIILKGPDLSSTDIINNWNFQQLLARGRGMTPGDVQPGATLQTQDKTGIPVPNAFYIQRYKDDTLADWLGNSERYITGTFSGPIPRPHSNIAIYVKNTTTDSTKLIHSVVVNRTVYEWPGGVQYVDIKPGEEVIVDLEGEEAEVSLQEDTIDLGELEQPASDDEIVAEPVANVAYNVTYDVNPLKRKEKHPSPPSYVIPY